MRAIVNVDETALAGLRVQLGADIVGFKRLSEGRFEAQIGGSSHREIAERLAGWGNTIDVVGPKAVRRHLARIGAELVEAYGIAARKI